MPPVMSPRPGWLLQRRCCLWLQQCQLALQQLQVQVQPDERRCCLLPLLRGL
jgi:hypothetical protein